MTNETREQLIARLEKHYKPTGYTREEAHAAVNKRATTTEKDKVGLEMKVDDAESEKKLVALAMESRRITKNLVKLNLEYTQITTKLSDIFRVKEEDRLLSNEQIKEYSSLRLKQKFAWIPFFKDHSKEIAEYKEKAIDENVANDVTTVAKLVHRLKQVYLEQEELAADGEKKELGIVQKSLAHIKSRDEKILEYLKTSFTNKEDEVAAMAELDKMKAEYAEIDSAISDLEGDIAVAREKKDSVKMNELVDQMTKLIGIKHGIMDGTYAAEGVLSDIRREILDRGVGIESAKSAIADGRLNLQAAYLSLDNWSEMRMKFKHGREDMFPVYENAVDEYINNIGLKNATKLLLETIANKNDMIAYNVQMAQALGDMTSRILALKTTDTEQSAESLKEIMQYREEKYQRDAAWAEAQETNRVSDNVQFSPGPAQVE